MQERRKTAVGRIAKSFGLSGELMVSLFDTFPADFDTKEPLFVVIDKLAVPLFCDRFERRGRRSALVVFSDFYSEKRTDELIGCELFLEGEEDVPDGEPLDPDADEFYPEDLVGFGVMVDEAGEGIVTGPEHSETGSDEQRSGCSADRIEEFIDGENPLFLLSLDGKSVYVPVADEFITEIDVAGRKIRMQLPEGLIDLND